MVKYGLDDLIKFDSDEESDEFVVVKKPPTNNFPSSSYSSSPPSPSLSQSLSISPPSDPSLSDNEQYYATSPSPGSPLPANNKGKAPARPSGRFGLGEAFGLGSREKKPTPKKGPQGGQTVDIWTLGLRVDAGGQGGGVAGGSTRRKMDAWRQGVVSGEEWVDPPVSPSSQYLHPRLASSPKLRTKSSLASLASSAGRLGKGKEKEKLKEKEKFVVADDEWERWERVGREEALRKAHLTTSHLSLSLSQTATSSLRTSQRSRQQQQAQEVKEMEELLGGMGLKEKEEEERLRRDFEGRRRELKESIETAIEKARKTAAEEADQASAQAESERRIAAATEAKRAAAKAESEQRAAKFAAEQAAEVEAARKAAEARAAKAAAEAEKVKVEAERVRVETAERARMGDGERWVDGLDIKRDEWRGWRAAMRGVREGVERVKAEEAVAKGLSLPKREVRKKVGMLRNHRDNVVKITTELHDILSKHLPTPPTLVQPASDLATLPLPYKFLLSHLCKTLIKQAENEVRAKADTAFPLAKIVLGLMLRGHKELGGVLMARFAKKCPWVVPYWPDMEQGQSMEDFRKSTGQKDYNPPETPVQHIERMSGILIFYLAICCTKLGPLLPTLPTALTNDSRPQIESLIPPCFRITACWSWLAGMLKGDLPTRGPASELISAGLETMGTELMEAFGVPQVAKVVFAIQKEGLGVGAGGEGVFTQDNVAGRERLKILLEKVVATKEFPVQEGKIWETATV